jgi:hypothetical protein
MEIEDTDFLSLNKNKSLLPAHAVTDKRLDAISFDTKKAKADRRKSTFVVPSPSVLATPEVRPQAVQKKKDDTLLRGAAARRVKLLANVAKD